jgi:hypothetical protein
LSSALAQIAVVLLVVTSLALLVSQDWRYSLLALAFQYVGVVILVGTQWPVSLAATKLLVGWMTSATLAFTQFSQKEHHGEKPWTAGWVFRLIAAAFVLLFLFSLAAKINNLLPSISAPQVQGSLVLIGIGLLQLGMSSSPFRVVLGLLTFLSGFEILYSAVEVSVLVAGMLAAVTLGLALVGTYLIVYSAPEGEGPS